MIKYSPKRLLFIAPTGQLTAGGELSHLELILDASKRHYEVMVVIPYPGELQSHLKAHGIKSTVFEYTHWNPETPLEATWQANILAITNIAKIINKYHIDTVITNTLNMPWGAIAASLTRRRHIWIARENPQFDWEYLQERFNFIASFSSVIMANSKELKQVIARHCPKASTRHFYSFVDVKNINLNTTITNSRLVCVGGIYDWKNQLGLIEPLSILKKEAGLTPSLLLVGGVKSTSYWAAIRRTARKLGVDKQIVHVDHVPDPYSNIGKNDIIIQPSNMESIGRVITEAMKLGLICVGADIPGTREAFALGGGNLYPANDSRRLASLLADILGNTAHYKKEAVHNQKRALTNLSLNACHDPFFKELESTSNILGSDLSYFYDYFVAFEQEKNRIDKQLHRLNSLEEEHRHLLSVYAEQKHRLNLIDNSRAWKMIRRIDSALSKLKK